MVLCRHPVLDDCQNAMLLSSRKVLDPQEGNRLLEFLESSWGVGGNKVGTRRSPWATKMVIFNILLLFKAKTSSGPSENLEIEPGGVSCGAPGN